MVATRKKSNEDYFISRGRVAPAFPEPNRPKPRSGFIDWLREPTFFPKSFGWERVIEQDRELYVLGNEEVYRYQLPSASTHAALRTAWAAARAEYHLLATLAPELFVGVRTFRWELGVPLWIEDEPRVPTSAAPPSGAEGFCVVLKRLFGAEGFSEFFSTGELQPILPVARRLRNWHETTLAAREREAAELSPEVLRKLFIPAEKQIEAIVSLLDTNRFAGLVALELFSFLRAFSGYDADTLRDYCSWSVAPKLSLNDLVFAKLSGRTSRGFLVPRVRAGSRRRVQHPLEEVASCALELSSEPMFRARFERSYGIDSSRWNDPELYRFFFIRSALLRGLESIATGRCQSGNLQAYSLERSQGESYLEAGFRELFGLRRRFLLVLEGATERLSSAVAAISGADLLPVPEELRLWVGHRGHFTAGLEDTLLGERLGSAVDRILSEGRSCVAPVAGVAQSAQLQEIGRRHRTPVCIIALSGSRPSASAILYSPLLPPEDNVIEILRLLGQSISRG